MHLYYVYAVKEEISKEYYYKTELLFRFFQEYHNNSHIDLYRMQFQFITKSFPDSTLIHLLKEDAGFDPKEFLEEEKMTKWVETHGIIEITNEMCLIQCDSLMDAEQLLFHKLRMIDHCFFIAEYANRQYGWISPQRKEMLL
ncbi:MULTISPECIES: sporulation inhibitor of replication protein SirA [Thalassobacillus]|uniref:sporulation inhibitor of replication protein SirA n=1 Tax=Thalassobacillus TaxID=331971 RepID=UPI000A1C85ED|nr:sporulation inhibitor of replication protein SirA [Thalassobacillus devorans]